MTCWKNNWKTRWLICICTALIFMLVCHGFLLFNPSYTHDALSAIDRRDGMYQASLGRFLQGPMKDFLSPVTATWLIGCITAFAIGNAAFLAAELLNVKGNLSIGFISAVMVSNYTMINSVGSYTPWLDTYGLALMFAVLGVWLAQQYRFGFIPGAFCFMITLGLYPPYFICSAAIMLIHFFFMFTENTNRKKIITTILYYAITLILGYGIYRLLLHFVLTGANITLADAENSMSRIQIFSLGALKSRLFRANDLFFERLFHTLAKLPGGNVFAWLFIASFVFGVIRLLLKSKTKVLYAILSVLLFLVTPSVFNLQYFVCEGATYHDLMVYSIYLAFVFWIAVYDRVLHADHPVPESKVPASDNPAPVKAHSMKTNRIIPQGFIYRTEKVLFLLLMILVLFADIRFANNVYTDRYLRERTTLSLITRIFGAAEQTEGYDPEITPVFVVGDINANPLVRYSGQPFYAVLGTAERQLTITYDLNSYLGNYLGYHFPGVSGEKRTELLNSPAVTNMPAYPATGEFSCSE